MPKNFELKLGISFEKEHGIYLKESTKEKYKIVKDEPLSLGYKYLTVENTRDFSEIDINSELISMIGLFESLYWSNRSFFEIYGFDNQNDRMQLIYPFLKDIFPEFEFKNRESFSYLYHYLKNKYFKVSHDKVSINKNSAEFKELFNIINEYHGNVDGIIGIGTLSSFYCDKNIELSYGISNNNIGGYSNISNKKIFINPYILFWVISEISSLDKNILKFNPLKIEISKININKLQKITKITYKSYIMNKELDNESLHKKEIIKLISQRISNKTIFYGNEFVYPISCPTLVDIELESIAEENYMSPFGDIPVSSYPSIIDEKTQIKYDFFNFPLYNQDVPVIIDTSAINFSRFPINDDGPFFFLFLYKRTIIIPKVVLWEVKRRLNTEDKVKILRALGRLQTLKNNKLIKNIIIKGDLFESYIPLNEKNLNNINDINDFRDCMVLDLAKQNNGILFTNDENLMRLAFSFGIYAVKFDGLEEDCIDVISKNNSSLTIKEAIPKIIAFGSNVRNEEYKDENIEWILNNIINRGEIIKSKIKNKEVLTYSKKRK